MNMKINVYMSTGVNAEQEYRCKHECKCEQEYRCEQEYWFVWESDCDKDFNRPGVTVAGDVL